MYSSDTASITSSRLSSLFSTTKSQASDNDERVLPTKLCFVGETDDLTASLIASSFEMPFVVSKTGEEYLDDPSFLFVFEDFQGDDFDKFAHLKWRVLGLPVLLEMVDAERPLPRARRPQLCSTMKGVVTCFTGLYDKPMVRDLMFKIRAMGGSVRQEPTRDTTHLIACITAGRKYNYAVTFIIPVMAPEWVLDCWAHRLVHGVHATDDAMMKHRQKPFLDVFASFVGFPENELSEATDLLVRNGGVPVSATDPRCTHIVADDLSPVCVPAGAPRTAKVVTAQWFWTCIQHVIREREDEFPVPLERYRRLPQRSSVRRPLRLDALEGRLPVARTDSQDADDTPEVGRDADDEEDDLELSRVALNSSPGGRGNSRWRRLSSLSLDGSVTPAGTPPKDAGSRRGSQVTTAPSTPELFISCRPCLEKPAREQGSGSRKCSERSDGSAGSRAHVSAASKRFRAFAELLQTEENYVGILDAILQMRSEALHTSQAGGVLLTQTEAKIIFGNLMPIARTHHAILKDMRSIYNNWTEEANVGEVYTKYCPDLLRDYAPFVSSFEESRSMIDQAAERSPRFHAFLKVCRGRPECGRQELHELMIRPVQRLGSCKLLLREILKHTPESSPDYQRLESALESLSAVLSLINEDKRKMESLCQVFDVFNVIENCPADIIASHRVLISQFEGVELNPYGFSKQGHQIAIFVFTDVFMICKKKSKVVALMKGRSGYQDIPHRVMKMVDRKPYKFIQILPMSCVCKIVDISVNVEGAPSVMGVVFRKNGDLRQCSSYLRLAEGGLERAQVVESCSSALAAHTCVPDPETFVLKQSMEDAGIAHAEFLHKHKRRNPLAAVTHAFVNNALSLGRNPSTASAGHPPCTMSTFNSTSRLETQKSTTDEMADDVFEKPQASSLTATIMKRL